MVGEEGVPPNMVYTYSAEVTDHTGKGTTYAGMGRSKKDAKKACAMEILMKVFNYIHPGTHNRTGNKTKENSIINSNSSKKFFLVISQRRKNFEFNCFNLGV